ncbi:MAG: hypothetical protein OK449_05115 [Thaumarchaeota archaeon]|nr:hypothetical protein [Nitrososphaerota archaeon]
MPGDDTLSKLFNRVGRYSRYAGLGFIILSIAFLILAVSDQFVVFEVDSLVAFLAAIFLLFRDPRARVQVGVLDATLTSSDRTIAELAAPSLTGFTYVATGNRVEDVFVIGADFEQALITSEENRNMPSLMFTPPGRGLAELYKREAGLVQVTMDALRASLSETMREKFGLARSASIDSKDDGVTISLQGAPATCSCGEGHTNNAKGGSIGCTVGSFLAVLVTTATKGPVSLEPCVHDANTDTWTVSMRLRPNIMVSS